MPRSSYISKLVKAVRKDPYLGKGTGSYIDETQTDKELGALIRETITNLHHQGKSVTTENVLNELTRVENLWREADDSSVFPQIDRTLGWEQKIQYDLGHRHPSQITASQEEYEKPSPFSRVYRAGSDLFEELDRDA